MPTEVSNFVQRRHGLTVMANMANMIDDSKHATSATGLASCGNRSNIDAGKRNSLIRECAFGELNFFSIFQKNNSSKTRRNGSEG